MKKIILLIFLFVGIIEAQTYTPQKADIKNPSKYTHQAAGDTLAPMVYLISSAGNILGTVTVTGGATAANQTNGTARNIPVNGSNQIIGVQTSPFYTTPDYAYIRSTDTWGSAADTSTYDFANRYLKGYFSVYDSSATADTLTIEMYSYTKFSYTAQMIGIKDEVTGYYESDLTTVIIPANTAKKFEIVGLRPGQIRVRPKTVVGRSVIKTKRISFVGVN